MNESKLMLFGMIVNDDSDMTQAVYRTSASKEHQVAPTKLFGVQDHHPAIVKLAIDGSRQFDAEMPEHEGGETRTIEFVRTIASHVVGDPHETFGIVDDAVGQSLRLERGVVQRACLLIVLDAEKRIHTIQRVPFLEEDLFAGVQDADLLHQGKRIVVIREIIIERVVKSGHLLLRNGVSDGLRDRPAQHVAAPHQSRDAQT